MFSRKIGEKFRNLFLDGTIIFVDWIHLDFFFLTCSTRLSLNKKIFFIKLLKTLLKYFFNFLSLKIIFHYFSFFGFIWKIQIILNDARFSQLINPALSLVNFFFFFPFLVRSYSESELFKICLWIQFYENYEAP